VAVKSVQMPKDERIAKETARLRRLFKNIPKDTLRIVESLIQNAAFMAVTLADLQATINRDGLVSEYQNGENQYGTKKSPEADIYNTMIKNHASVLRQLTDLLPADAAKPQEVDPLQRLLIRKNANGGKNDKGG
jgi:hypothetical protein